ncbi:hypothetical protein BHM03_00045679, partial [Ensete ventricosum]
RSTIVATPSRPVILDVAIRRLYGLPPQQPDSPDAPDQGSRWSYRKSYPWLSVPPTGILTADGGVVQRRAVLRLPPKVSKLHPRPPRPPRCNRSRATGCASSAGRGTRSEPPSPTATSCASSAPAITAASACTSPSSWTVTRMECSGNDRLNAFLARRSVPRDADPAAKYNSRAAAAYRGRIQALAEGRPWQDPPVVKEATTKPSARKPPRSQSGRDRWGGDHLAASSNMRRNQSVGDLRRGSGRQGGAATEDLPAMAQKPANKESYFARKMDAVALRRLSGECCHS